MTFIMSSYNRLTSFMFAYYCTSIVQVHTKYKYFWHKLQALSLKTLYIIKKNDINAFRIANLWLTGVDKTSWGKPILFDIWRDQFIIEKSIDHPCQCLNVRNNNNNSQQQQQQLCCVSVGRECCYRDVVTIIFHSLLEHHQQQW